MRSNEEKYTFVKLLIDKFPDKINDIAFWSEIHGFLMTDTADGKLYKYRSVNENALNNLKNQTLYGALPSTFNDPFDSRMGFELRSFMETKYHLEFNLLEEIFKEYLLILDGKKELASCSVKNRDSVILLLKNERLNNFYRRQLENDFSLEIQKEGLVQHANMVIEAISTLISDQDIKRQMEVSSLMIPRIVENISPEGRYIMNDNPESFEDYARAMGVLDDADEITLAKILYLIQFPSRYVQANKMDQTLTNMDKQMSQAIDNMFRVVSLAADCKNRLMWSHYADGHKGFCIEYDFGIKNYDDDYACILPVIYSTVRPKFPWRVMIDENAQAPFADIMLALLTKDEAWSYEREWRVLIPSMLGKSEVCSPPITCIYLGALCSEKDKESISEIANELKVPLKKMVVDRGEYNIHIQSVS